MKHKQKTQTHNQIEGNKKQNNIFRQVHYNHDKRKKKIQKQLADGQAIDKLLHHMGKLLVSFLTYVFQNTNITSQQILIKLMNHKETISYTLIKNIYKILTEGKANQLCFINQKQNILDYSYQNNKYIFRFNWRTIQNIIYKVCYYATHQKYLSVISKTILESIKINKTMFNELNSTNITLIIQFFDLIVDQNFTLETKIYQLLINRGYVSSMQEFYWLNRLDNDESLEQKIEKNQNQAQKKQKNSQSNQNISYDQNISYNQNISQNQNYKIFSKIPKISASKYTQSEQKSPNKSKKNEQSQKNDQINSKIQRQLELMVKKLINSKQLSNYLSHQQPNDHQSSVRTLIKNNPFTRKNTIKQNQVESHIQNLYNPLKSRNVSVNSVLISLIGQTVDKDEINFMQKDNINDPYQEKSSKLFKMIRHSKQKNTNNKIDCTSQYLYADKSLKQKQFVSPHSIRMRNSNLLRAPFYQNFNSNQIIFNSADLQNNPRTSYKIQKKLIKNMLNHIYRQQLKKFEKNIQQEYKAALKKLNEEKKNRVKFYNINKIMDDKQIKLMKKWKQNKTNKQNHQIKSKVYHQLPKQFGDQLLTKSQKQIQSLIEQDNKSSSSQKYQKKVNYVKEKNLKNETMMKRLKPCNLFGANKYQTNYEIWDVRNHRWYYSSRR